VVEQKAFVKGNPDAGTDGTHGTCMASYLMGTYSGVAKYARVKSYKLSDPSKPPPKNGGPPPFSAFTLLWAVQAAIQDLDSDRNADPTGTTRNAIINLSCEGMQVQQTFTAGPNSGMPWIDPWEKILGELEAKQIFMVYAAGNDPTNELQNITPQRWAAKRDYLIVVGLVNSKGTLGEPNRIPQTQEGSSDALSLYAYAHHIVCAKAGTTSEYFTNTGTSGATAIVSGMLAVFLKHFPGSANTAKQTLKETGLSRKPPIASPKQPGGVPRVAFQAEVGCSADLPTSPEDSRPTYTSKANIPIPTFPPGNFILGGKVDDILAHVSPARTATSTKPANSIVQGVPVPCQQWPAPL
jgi:hypothetical protein